MSALIALMLRLWIAWQPVEELSWRVTADDAYYYFRLAQNISLGKGFTFDGIHLTNGFHPLYALLLVPIFGAIGNDLALGVHLALTLVALLSTITAWPVYRIGQRFGSNTAFIGTILYLLNPWTILLPMTGVELAVYGLAFAFAVEAYLVWRIQPTLQRSIIAGAALGLTIMGRSEGGLLLIGVLIDILWRNRHTLTRAMPGVLGIFVPAAVICLPWAIWSTSNFGTPFQVSGPAIMLLSHVDQPATLEAQVQWYLGRTLWFSARYAYKIVLFNLPVAAGAGILIWLSIRRERARAAWKASAPMSFLIVPFILISIYYNALLWQQQHWYFGALVLITTLVAAPILANGFHQHLDHRMIWTGFVMLVALCLLTLALVWHRGFYAKTDQRGRYLAGRWIAASPFQSETFAASDNGLLGYYCQCKMVNTEGVVNNSIYAYYQTHGYSPQTLGNYLQAQDIRYVVLPQIQNPVSWGDHTLVVEQLIGNSGWAIYQFMP